MIISWLILGQCVFILTRGCLLPGTGSGAPSTYGVNQDARYPTSLQSSLCKCVQHTEEAGSLFPIRTVFAFYLQNRWVSAAVALLELSSHHSNHYKNCWRSDESEKGKNNTN